MERARVSHLSRFHRHTEPSAAQEAMLSAEGGSERVAWGWNTIAPVRSLWPAGEKKSHELERATVYVSVKFHLGLAISHAHQHVPCLVTFTSQHRERRQKACLIPSSPPQILAAYTFILQVTKATVGDWKRGYTHQPLRTLIGSQLGTDHSLHRPLLAGDGGEKMNTNWLTWCLLVQVHTNTFTGGEWNYSTQLTMMQ